MHIGETKRPRKPSCRSGDHGCIKAKQQAAERAYKRAPDDVLIQAQSLPPSFTTSSQATGEYHPKRPGTVSTFRSQQAVNIRGGPAALPVNQGLRFSIRRRALRTRAGFR